MGSGVLMLTLDEDTHQQLGLQGRQTDIRLLKKRRFGKSITITAIVNVVLSQLSSPLRSGADVEIDMKNRSFRAGNKLYDRVLWCFRDRVEPLDLLIFHMKGTGLVTRILLGFEMYLMVYVMMLISVVFQMVELVISSFPMVSKLKRSV